MQIVPQTLCCFVKNDFLISLTGPIYQDLILLCCLMLTHIFSRLKILFFYSLIESANSDLVLPWPCNTVIVNNCCFKHIGMYLTARVNLYLRGLATAYSISWLHMHILYIVSSIIQHLKLTLCPKLTLVPNVNRMTEFRLMFPVVK